MELHTLIDDHRDELISKLFDELRSSSAPHYRRAELPELERRCARLVDELSRAVRKSPHTLGDYLCSASEDRIAEGYALGEMQLALNVLEHEVWRLVGSATTESEPLLRLLALASGTIGSAKDRLAHSFLLARNDARARASSLERKLELLFRGTDANDTWPV